MLKRLTVLSILLSLLGSPRAFAQIADTSAASSCRGGYSSTFTVNGTVQNTLSFDPQTLSAFTPQTSDTADAEYTGALLWEIINQAGLANNSAIKNDADRKYVMVTGSKCQQALFSIGELDPSVGGGPHQVIVAFKRAGHTLAHSAGFAEIVSPADKTNARWITNITNIEVIEEVAGPSPG